MKIEIQDASVEARLQEQMRAMNVASAEEAILHLLESKEENDRWFQDNRPAVNAKIRRGLDQLDRGEGILEEDLGAYLAKLKAERG